MRHALLTAGVLAAALGIVLPSRVLAAVIVVDTLADGESGPACTLRSAIVAANTDAPAGGCPAGAGDDTIELGALAGTILLQSALPTLGGGGQAALVHGPGADLLAISGGEAHVVFTTSELIAQGTTIEGVTIRDGSPYCVLAEGFLTLRDSRITSCTSSGGGAVDMGLFGFRLIVDRCLLDANTGGWAIRTGGTAGSGALWMLSSTVSGNDRGILITNNEGVGTSRLYASTLADNREVNVQVQADQRVALDHTILKRHPGGPRRLPGVNCVLLGVFVLPPGTPNVSSFASLADDASCGLVGQGDLEGVDPLLGALADNGGPTFSRAPLPGSPVIDAGESACPGPEGDLLLDQRGPGFPRPLPGAPDAPTRCDLGAIEVPEPGASGGLAAACAALALARAAAGRVRRRRTGVRGATRSLGAGRSGQ